MGNKSSVFSGPVILDEHARDLYGEMVKSEKRMLNDLIQLGARVWVWDNSVDWFVRAFKLNIDEYKPVKAVVLLSAELREQASAMVAGLAVTRDAFRVAAQHCAESLGRSMNIAARSAAEPTLHFDAQSEGVLFSTPYAFRSADSSVADIRNFLEGKLRKAQYEFESRLIRGDAHNSDLEIKLLQENIENFDELTGETDCESFRVRYLSGNAIRVRLLIPRQATRNFTFQRLLLVCAKDGAEVMAGPSRKTHRRLGPPLRSYLGARLQIYPARH